MVPHSFLYYIFLNKEEYENGKTRAEVLHHELTHVQQKHSLDILFIELLHTLMWFNPILLFYRRAIMLNHEFLADDSVIQTFGNTKSYQYLLLDNISRSKRLLFTSTLNYLVTKKRLIMMTKTTTRAKAIIRQTAVVPLLTGALLLFATYAYTQELENKKGSTVTISEKGISPTLFNEYETALKNAEFKAALSHSFEVAVPDSITKKTKKIRVKLDKAYLLDKIDRKRMDYLYIAMSAEQKKRATNVDFIPTPPAPPKKSPSADQLAVWSKSKEYRIWLDGERVWRGELKKFKPSDFVYYRIKEVQTNSIDYKQFSYYVDVMTPDYYKACYIDKTKWNLRIGRGEPAYLTSGKK